MEEDSQQEEGREWRRRDDGEKVRGRREEEGEG